MSTARDNSGTKQLNRFRPYQGSTLDAPFFHILLEPCIRVLQPLLASIYAIRWQLSRPLQLRILPKWAPFIDFPVLKDLPFITYGQVMLALPLLIIFLSGYYFTFVFPDIKSSGSVASYAMFATFLTANKSNSLVAFLFGIPFERMIPYHNLSALTTVTLACFHGYVAYAYGEGGDGGDESSVVDNLSQTSGNDANDDRHEHGVSWDDRRLDSEDSQYALMGANPNLPKFLFDGDTNTSGSLLALSMIFLVLCSIFPTFRRRFFDVWFWIHILSAIFAIMFCTLHGVTSILFIASWWCVDIFMRYMVMAGCRYSKRANLDIITKDVVRVSFVKPRGFQYNAGQFIQIAFKELGPLSFHPVSISSAPNEDEVTVHFRALGDWTKKLYQLAKSQKEASVFIEGPYGSLSVDIDDSRYQMALLFCGGIGVTHCKSVAKSLVHQCQTGRKLKNLRFIWSVRDMDMLNVMEPLESGSCSRDIEMVDISEFPTEIMDESDSAEISRAPNGLQESKVVETNIFLTNGAKSEPIMMDDGRVLSFGRPDLDAIVGDTKERALKDGLTHVAVFVCGPKVLVDKVKDVCRKQSQALCQFRGVTFDVHEEIFEF